MSHPAPADAPCWLSLGITGAEPAQKFALVETGQGMSERRGCLCASDRGPCVEEIPDDLSLLMPSNYLIPGLPPS